MELQAAAIMFDFTCEYVFDIDEDYFDEIVALGYDYAVDGSLMLDDLRGIWPSIYFTAFYKFNSYDAGDPTETDDGGFEEDTKD